MQKQQCVRCEFNRLLSQLCALCVMFVSIVGWFLFSLWMSNFECNSWVLHDDAGHLDKQTGLCSDRSVAAPLKTSTKIHLDWVFIFVFVVFCVNTFTLDEQFVICNVSWRQKWNLKMCRFCASARQPPRRRLLHMYIENIKWSQPVFICPEDTPSRVLTVGFLQWLTLLTQSDRAVFDCFLAQIIADTRDTWVEIPRFYKHMTG